MQVTSLSFAFVVADHQEHAATFSAQPDGKRLGSQGALLSCFPHDLMRKSSWLWFGKACRDPTLHEMQWQPETMLEQIVMISGCKDEQTSADVSNVASFSLRESEI